MLVTGSVFFILTQFAHHIRSINDPEHPLTLEQLNVVDESRVKVIYVCIIEHVVATQYP